MIPTLDVADAEAIDPAETHRCHRPNKLIHRLARCMGVSVVTTAISLVTLAVGTAALGMPGWVANVVATTLATGPSCHLNRRWTWGRRDTSNLWCEILPFWLLSFAGLVLSTIAVGVADAWAGSLHLAPSSRTSLLLVAHLSGFGVLWIVQFILLDRVLFGREPRARTTPPRGQPADWGPTRSRSRAPSRAA